MAYCDWDVDREGRDYHDNIWGKPLHDDVKHFEFIAYEVLQCGLSWWLVYGKREILRGCFDGFDFTKVAQYGDMDVDRILKTPGMIKSESKIRAIINNAKRYLEVIERFGTFDNYLWRFSEYKTIIYSGHMKGRIPASNGLSEKISKDLKSRGFKYLGPVVVYSHLQACGIINDHDENCECYKEAIRLGNIVFKRAYKEKGVIDFGKNK